MHHYCKHFRTQGSGIVAAGTGEVRLPSPPANLDWKLQLISVGLDIAPTGTVAVYVNSTQGHDCIGFKTAAANDPAFVIAPHLEYVVDDSDTIIVRGTSLGAATRIDVQVWYELVQTPAEIPSMPQQGNAPGVVNPQLPLDTNVSRLAPDLFLDVA